MANRLDLQHSLEEVLGNKNVYYNPPESVKMKYPAIKYSLKNIKNVYADGAIYNQNAEYELILIDKDPDSKYVNEIYKKHTRSTFSRSYTADGLHHWVFNLYNN